MRVRNVEAVHGLCDARIEPAVCDEFTMLASDGRNALQQANPQCGQLAGEPSERCMLSSHLWQVAQVKIAQSDDVALCHRVARGKL
jgi:hypothetical protein